MRAGAALPIACASAASSRISAGGNPGNGAVLGYHGGRKLPNAWQVLGAPDRIGALVQA